MTNSLITSQYELLRLDTHDIIHLTKLLAKSCFFGNNAILYFLHYLHTFLSGFARSEFLFGICMDSA